VSLGQTNRGLLKTFLIIFPLTVISQPFSHEHKQCLFFAFVYEECVLVLALRKGECQLRWKTSKCFIRRKHDEVFRPFFFFFNGHHLLERLLVCFSQSSTQAALQLYNFIVSLIPLASVFVRKQISSLLFSFCL